MVCIVMIIIRMPNESVCPIQVVTQDADMAETLILMDKSSKFGAIVARMKQVLGIVAIF